MRVALPALIGVVSDTHGSLDARVLGLFEGVDVILHAGDVGSPAVLMELETVAPVLAVRGNMDDARWAEDLPASAVLDAGPWMVDLAHDPDVAPRPDAAVVVRGHTHRPGVDALGDRIEVNPGSVSRPRGRGAVPSVALIELDEDGVRARIVAL